MKLTDAQREKIMKMFDWEKVRAFMVLTKWTWSDKKHSPSIEELQMCVFDNLIRSINEEGGSCSTGGFTVENSGGTLVISFDYAVETVYV